MNGAGAGHCYWRGQIALLTAITVGIGTRASMAQEVGDTDTPSHTVSASAHGPARHFAPGTPARETASPRHANCRCLTDHDRELLSDFGGLMHYEAANTVLSPLASGENRVVSIGDSITKSWKIEGPYGTFPGKPYINRGIGAQTTSQMFSALPTGCN